MSKPRRKYDSPEAVRATLDRKFQSILKEYLEPPNPPDVLYQYRCEDILLRTLNSGKMWARDLFRRDQRGETVSAMNDPDEITYGFVEVIGSVASTRKDGVPKYFVSGVKSPEEVRKVFGGFCTHITCFSSTAELPEQWRDYAGGCTGYAIGLDRSRLDEWCKIWGVDLFPMSYDRSRHENMIRDLLEAEVSLVNSRSLAVGSPARESLREKTTTNLMRLAVTMKREKWQKEQEWRILVIQVPGEGRFERRTRPEDGACYFELPICTPEIVREVVLGPLCTTDLAEVRRQLDSAGLTSVGVRRCLCQCQNQR